MIYGLAVLDQGSKSVQIFVNGEWQGTWGPVDGRDDVLSAIAPTGWRYRSAADKWEASVYHNGHVRHVVKDA